MNSELKGMSRSMSQGIITISKAQDFQFILSIRYFVFKEVVYNKIVLDCSKNVESLVLGFLRPRKAYTTMLKCLKFVLSV